MIESIIDALDLAASAQLPTALRSGLAELKRVTGGTAPFLYAGGSDWRQLATDAGGTYSYWRLTSPVIEVGSDGPSCNDYFQATYQLRLVSLVDRELCAAVPDAARSAASAIRGADVDVAAALALSPRSGVTRVQVDLDSAKVYQQEFGVAGDVPPGKSLVAIDVTLVAIGRASCFAPCAEPESLLCMTIGIATWARIKACMSEAQIDAAEADLCEGGPCEPTTVNGTESDTPTITVLQGGVEVGTLNPATGVHTVPECPPPDPCDPLTVTVNDVIEFTEVPNPCGASVNVPVINEDDEEVGTLVDGKIVVPTARSLCGLITDGTSEEVANCIISSGKRVGVLAELIPSVDPSNVLADVIGPMTPDQDDVVAVTIEDQTATPIATVAPGGTYQVIVVSGIDGGESDTTYTNSIIQP